MFESLKPKVYLESLIKIDLKKIKNEMKIKGIIIDLDNTSVAWGKDDIDEDIIKWINEAKDINMSLCLVSNTHTKRVKKFADVFDIPYFSNAFKPFHFSFQKAIKILGTEYSETMVIGDQIFTDILGGNRLNMYTILVAPLGKRDSIGTFIQRSLEKIILDSWLKAHKIKIEEGNWPK